MILPRPIDAPRFFPGDPDGHNTCGEDPGIRLEALGQLEQSGESELRFERLFAKRRVRMRSPVATWIALKRALRSSTHVWDPT
jgi:hypothetical protein